jgi:hypothetical protein
MHPPFPVLGLRQKAAIGAVETMEETMRVYTINELMRLIRTELCAFAAQITHALAELPEGSTERLNALINLRNIRRVMMRRDLSPWRCERRDGRRVGLLTVTVMPRVVGCSASGYGWQRQHDLPTLGRASLKSGVIRQ